MRVGVVTMLCSLAGLVLFAACAILPRAGAPVSAERRLVHTKCAACHLVPEPNRLRHQEITQMFERHQRRVPLTAAQQQEIRAYLLRGKNP